jgi:alkylated DNA nucleotide flippase Atl1
MQDKSALFQRTITLVKYIPREKVLTYSAVSNLISAPGCARHVSYILSSSSKNISSLGTELLTQKARFLFL